MIRVLVTGGKTFNPAKFVRELSCFSGIEAVPGRWELENGFRFVREITQDVVVLGLSGSPSLSIRFLQYVMAENPKPVVILSPSESDFAEPVIKALESGAMDAVVDPGDQCDTGRDVVCSELAVKIRCAAGSEISHWKKTAELSVGVSAPGGSAAFPAADWGNGDVSIVAVGASTGGTVTVHRLLNLFSPEMPPIALTLPMDRMFTEKFVEYLNRATPFDVFEARNGSLFVPGTVLVAPGNRHLSVARRSGGFVAQLSSGPKVNGHRPSAGVLFASVARAAGRHGMGIILTGTGRDGAVELLSIREAGGRTIAQDESTSVAWGMPSEAIRLGAVEDVLPIDQIGKVVMARLEGVRV